MKVEKLIGSKTRIVMLKHLCKNPDRDFSIAELARELHMDKSMVSKTVSILEKEKVIDVYKRGNMKLCKLNSKNNICAALTDMFNKIENAKKGRRKR
ncbi:MAG: winged helix-turn-helix domain-containing protein [Candidatus Aenigmatarchaeota archaeon]